MDFEQLLAILFRWMHVLTAIVIFGGSVFMRYVLMPAGESLPTDAHETLRERVMGTWKKFVHIGIALFLISGLYNYIRVMIPQHRGDGLYHALLGTKIILAIVIFFLASVLVGRSAKFEKLRQNRKMWLGVIVLLATVIVLISGYLKVRGPKIELPDTPTAALYQSGEPTTSVVG